MFSDNEINTNILNKALNGDLKSQNEIAYSLWMYSENNSISYNAQETVYINHLYLLSIQIIHSEFNENTYYHYSEQVH